MGWRDGLFIIPNVNCIIIALIDSVSGPLWSHLELGSGPGHGGEVWEHWVRPNIKLSITVQRSRLDLNNHD